MSEENRTAPHGVNKVTAGKLFGVAIGAVLLALLTVGIVNIQTENAKFQADMEEFYQGLREAAAKEKANIAKEKVNIALDASLEGTESLESVKGTIASMKPAEVIVPDESPSLKSCQSLIWTVPAELLVSPELVGTDSKGVDRYRVLTKVGPESSQNILEYVLSHPDLKPTVTSACSDKTRFLPTDPKALGGVSFKSEGIQSPACMEVPSGHVCSLAEQSEPELGETQFLRDSINAK
jgi:hypothetical protein